MKSMAEVSYHSYPMMRISRFLNKGFSPDMGPPSNHQKIK
jgi:hypothetical protein